MQKCMHACADAWMHGCRIDVVCMYACMHSKYTTNTNIQTTNRVRLHASMHACMLACNHERRCFCNHAGACIHACMHAHDCMRVCVSVRHVHASCATHALARSALRAAHCTGMRRISSRYICRRYICSRCACASACAIARLRDCAIARLRG